jgi:hypothetical protein
MPTLNFLKNETKNFLSSQRSTQNINIRRIIGEIMTDRETIKLERKINSKKTVIRLMCRKGIRSFEIQET